MRLAPSMSLRGSKTDLIVAALFLGNDRKVDSAKKDVKLPVIATIPGRDMQKIFTPWISPAHGTWDCSGLFRHDVTLKDTGPLLQDSGIHHIHLAMAMSRLNPYDILIIPHWLHYDNNYVILYPHDLKLTQAVNIFPLSPAPEARPGSTSTPVKSILDRRWLGLWEMGDAASFGDPKLAKMG